MVRIARDRVDLQVDRRGIDYATWARRANVSPATVNRVINTGRVREDAFRKLVQALVDTPVLEGADCVLDGRQSETTRGVEVSRTSQGG